MEFSNAECSHISVIGNGFCNDEANNPECNYDSGDCCGSCINTDYCIECACTGNVMGNVVQNALVGDGVCNDETNNFDCHYDGFDCCQDPVDKSLCINCSCHGELIIL